MPPALCSLMISQELQLNQRTRLSFYRAAAWAERLCSAVSAPRVLLAARARVPPRGCQLHTETSPWKRLQWRDLSGRNLQNPSTTEGVYEEVILFTHPSIRQRHRDASDVRGHSRQVRCLCADGCSRGWLFRGEHTVLLQLPEAGPQPWGSA